MFSDSKLNLLQSFMNASHGSDEKKDFNSSTTACSKDYQHLCYLLNSDAV